MRGGRMGREKWWEVLLIRNWTNEYTRSGPNGEPVSGPYLTHASFTAVRETTGKIKNEHSNGLPKIRSGAIKAMYGLATYLQDCGLEKSLLHLVYLRASQMNGCAFFVDMHTD